MDGVGVVITVTIAVIIAVLRGKVGDEGEAVSTQHPAVVLSNDSLAVGLVASNGTGTNLAVWIYDGSTLSRHNITNHTDLNSELQLTTLANGSLLLASLTTAAR